MRSSARLRAAPCSAPLAAIASRPRPCPPQPGSLAGGARPSLFDDPQLQLLEHLLWRGSPGRRQRRWAAPLRALLRGAIAAALRSVRAEVADASLQYTQRGDVGPWCVGRPAHTADALRIGVRLARLMPGAAPGAHDAERNDARAPAEAAAAAEATAAGASGGAGVAPGGGASATFSIEGVSCSLLTRALHQAGAKPGAAVQASGPAGQQQQPRHRRQRKQEAGAAGGDGGAAAGGGEGGGQGRGDDEWDSEMVVLRQWFAHATLRVSRWAPAAPSPAASGDARPGGAAGAPPAVQLVVVSLGGMAGLQQRLRAPAAAGGRAAAGAGCHVSAAVALKSLVLEVSPKAAAVFLRLVNR